MRTGLTGRRRGFTLVETVVTVGIVAALAAVVYPTVVKQFDSADPTRLVEDLNNIRTGVETFGVNVRPHQPKDIEDLANLITSAAPDSSARAALYTASDIANWQGPYIALSLDPTIVADAAAITSGYGALILNRFKLYDADVGVNDTVPSPGTNADFLAVRITGLSGAAYNSVNLLVDGPSENTAALRRQNGRFRCLPNTGTDTDACTSAYYFVSPIR
jgi:prepilin-type N-terminal cleavage/methylation domain-containing protein